MDFLCILLSYSTVSSLVSGRSKVCDHLAIVFDSYFLQHLKYHSEIVSVHGFHFEVKAAKDADTDSKYLFYLQVCEEHFKLFNKFV